MTDIDLSTMAVAVSHHFAAPIESVWGLLSDVEQMAGLGPEHYEAHWLSPGPMVGATFLGKNRRANDQWEVTCYIIECEPPKKLVWTVMNPAKPSSTWSYTLAPVGPGTEVVQTFRHGPGPSGVRSRIAQNPDRADRIIRRRTETLRLDMKTTMVNAEQKLLTR
jgi:uncharacterized protein YndB with AHSA1/START domain